MGTKRMNASRRSFLKKSAAIAGTILATSAMKPFTAIIFAANEPDDPTKPWYGIGIDIKKCIGCGTCARACNAEAITYNLSGLNFSGEFKAIFWNSLIERIRTK